MYINPTQKPLELLERIIEASTKKDELVLDPFCGCATTCIAAERLERQWIGIDISIKAYELVKERLRKEVANEEDLFQFKNKINFKTDAPKRTDLDKEYKHKKWIYIISNASYENEYKVGVARNWKNRLNTYQTYDPNRQYKIEYKIDTAFYREIESHIHEKFDNRHEWVRAKLPEIIKEIKKASNKLIKKSK